MTAPDPTAGERDGIALVHQSDEAVVQAVLAERVRQIDKGYTPDHDDQHTPEEILAFGGVDWIAPTREQLVRAGACILAAIARMDRAGVR